MRIRTWQLAIVVTSLAGGLFLAPAVVAQDEKDAEIRKLQALLEKQDKYIQSQKALLDNALKVTDSYQKSQEAALKLLNELTKTVAEREKEMIKLARDGEKQRQAADAMAVKAQSLEEKNALLEKRVKELTAMVDKLGLKLDPPKDKGPVKPNPPNLNLSGKIVKVDGDLVQISLGADHGLRDNHTLEVYRLDPEPKYLGMIRIVDANQYTSVARIVVRGNGKDAFRPMFKEGDAVTSRLK